MAYRFKCRHCQSGFSLEQQRDDHEVECAKVGPISERTAPATRAAVTSSSGIAKPCKYCGQVFTNFGQYGAHRWQAHRAEVLADLAKSRAARKVDEARIDAQLTSGVAGQPAERPPARPPKSNGAGAAQAATCPTCGGIVPAETAALVAELAALGLAEPQAFAAARIARRVFGSQPAN